MNKRPALRNAGSILLALLAWFACYRLIVDAATTGISRLFTTTAIFQSTLEPADRAVRLTPRDPEAHYTRGLALVNLERLEDAVSELQQAIRLRPHHYYEWLDLGVTLDRLGNQAAAVVALRESVRLAPSFAQPRWQLGNLLFREGQYDEAFGELRRAASSNRALFSTMVELAWITADGDVGRMEQLVKPATPRNRLQLARFLAEHDKGADVTRQVRMALAEETPSEETRAILREIISKLIASERFPDAYSVWAATHVHIDNDNSSSSSQLLNNADFVEPVIQDDPGFGWQLPATPSVAAAIDPAGPDSGGKSLRLEFAGETDPAAQLIRQLVLLQANTRYSLRFMAKVENLVSGGPPVVIASTAGPENSKILGRSDPLPLSTTTWTAYQLEFATEPNTSAVVIALQRLPCNQSPCPIFGRLWLSKFSLTKRS